MAFVAGLLLAAGSAPAKGSKADEVREYLDKATAAFALNRYAAAAENYEKAFELKPDPAVLYNAAQAHRLAGNKQRALELYQSYLRMYGAEKRAEVEQHIEALKQAIEKDRAVATSPPVTPAPVGGAGGAAGSVPPPASPEPSSSSPVPGVVADPSAPASPLAPPPSAPRPADPAPALITQSPRTAEGGSVLGKPWFWIAVGGAVVAAVVTGVLLARSGPSDPTASIGPPVDGN